MLGLGGFWAYDRYAASGESFGLIGRGAARRSFTEEDDHKILQVCCVHNPLPLRAAVTRTRSSVPPRTGHHGACHDLHAHPITSDLAPRPVTADAPAEQPRDPSHTVSPEKRAGPASGHHAP